MSHAIKVTDCWGNSFYICSSPFPPYHIESQLGMMLTFMSPVHASYFIATLSGFDIQRLCHCFIHNGQPNRQIIETAIYSGQLKVFPEIQPSHLESDIVNNSSSSTRYKPEKKQNKALKEARSLITIRSDIKVRLRQIVDQERIEAQTIEKQYQQKSALGKTSAHISRFAHGLHGAGVSFLIWVKDVHDVVNLNQRLFRIMKAATTAESANDGQRYQVFKQTLAESEKKELVEALGFDPAQITLEKLKQAYELAYLIYEDQLTRVIILQFVKDYTDAQHSLEVSEFSGGAAFEVILTALLAIATGGVGAIASLGAQARKLSQLKKLGSLLSELADELKKRPKPNVFRLHKQKEVEDKKESKRQAQQQKPTAKKPDKVDKTEEADNNEREAGAVVSNKSNTAQRIGKLDLDGHAPIRHGGSNRVTGQQLEDRAVRGIDPASGTTLDAFNKFPNGSPKPHKVGRNATAFVSDEALLHADDFARNSTQFQQNIAAAIANGDLFVDAVELPLKDVFGNSYQNSVRGITRLGSKNNPTGHVPTDFTDGTIKAIYRLDQSGNVKLHTLYPNPKP